MKRGESNSTIVRSDFIKENDLELLKKLAGDKVFDEEKEVMIDLELHKMIKVEDWSKDGKGLALKRILRKGKGSSPNADSTVKGTLHLTLYLFCFSVLKNYSEWQVSAG